RAQRLQMEEPGGAREHARVGDGVGGAREQIREADWLAQISGNDAEREVEAPADPPQKTAQQVFVASASRSRSGAAAGRASPWPSSGSPGTSGRGPCPSELRLASAA